MSARERGLTTASGRLCEVANGRFMALQFAKTLIRLTDRFGDGRLTGVGREATFVRPRNGHSMLRGVFAVIAERHDNEISLVITIARLRIQIRGPRNA